jgi:hypothetical protein
MSHSKLMRSIIRVNTPRGDSLLLQEEAGGSSSPGSKLFDGGGGAGSDGCADSSGSTNTACSTTGASASSSSSSSVGGSTTASSVPSGHMVKELCKLMCWGTAGEALAEVLRTLLQVPLVPLVLLA